jgi:hypothetical protein
MRATPHRLDMHAVLITAYKDYPTLLHLVRRLDPAFFRLFIHIDKKSRFTSPQIDRLRALGAEVSQSFVVRWGSYTHLLAILDLMGAACRHGGFDYIHVISGQDYPLRDAREFARRCDGRIFMDHGRLEQQPQLVRDRYELRDPFHVVLTGRFGSRGLHKFLTRKTHRIRSWFSPRRTRFGPYPYSALHKSLVWSSFPASAAGRLLDDPKAKAFLQAIRNTRIAEEIFFATYFLNSDLAPLAVKDDLRYADWRERNGSNPAYLDESDAEAVLRSDALFARKVSSECSARLLETIDAMRFGSGSWDVPSSRHYDEAGSGGSSPL